jgi:hypothetical protein
VRRGSCRGLITSQDATRAPPPATIGVCLGASRGGSRGLEAYQAVFPLRRSLRHADRSCRGGARRERGRGSCRGPWPPKLPPAPYRRPYIRTLTLPTFVTCCAASANHVHTRYTYAPPPIAAPTTRANVTTLSDMLVAVMNISPTPWNSPPPKRREEGGSCRGRPASQVATRALPPTCRLHHPRPRAPPLAPRTPRSQLLPERSNEGV